MRYPIIFCSLVCACSLGIGDANSADFWSGAWSDDEGGVLLIRQDGRFLDVDGKDTYSIYHSVCLLSEDFKNAQCQGQGIQVKSGNRFLLRSRWQMSGDGFVEKWAIDMAERPLSGELVFSRIGRETE